MKIHKRQLQAFGKAVEEMLECRLVAHAERLWPERCERMGRETVRQWVRAGVRRARGCGIEAEYDLSRFVDLLFLLGRDFDTDPAAAWAGEILQATDVPAAERLDRIFARAEAHLAAPAKPAEAPDGPAGR